MNINVYKTPNRNIVNLTEYGIFGRPILWWLFEYLRAPLERAIVRRMNEARKSGEWAPRVHDSAYFMWLGKWEFRFRNWRDIVPDSQFRI